MPPDSIHIRKSTEGHAPLLKSLLEQNDLKAFYHHAKTVLSELNAMRRHGTMTREEACDMLWSLYPIGGAPMYEAPDYDSVQPWPYKDERNNDIAAKSGVISALSIMDTKQMSRNLDIHEQRLKHLHAAYAAAIIKRLKSLHLPDFGKKETALKDEIIRSHPANPDGNVIGTDIKDYEWTHRWNNLVTFSSRNSMYHSYVSKIMEKRFMPMLVKYFPDQAGEVVKYIRKAGYEDGEVLDLIDRTAGYNSNTAYLYQGKSGEEHRKKLQQKYGNPCPDMSRNANK
ncbi:hypothetical protein [Akkermansia muciniphila]|uniref:hypothetical protein n=1 Tax=Akkermansia muciniphila TaxID=239935 RepID=UPI00122F44E8|nr:hypothetical protein [Akkermansia muciniphila]KAA3386403.1 hypothetical protein F1896_10315 [Akkermansia muciniphila]